MYNKFYFKFIGQIQFSYDFKKWEDISINQFSLIKAPQQQYNNIIMEQINSQIRAFLGTSPNDEQLTDFMNNMSPQLKPTLKWHQLNPQSLKQSTLVYAHLMVQDIRDEYYYYSFIMKRPFNAQYLLYKFGNKAQQLSAQQEDQMLQSNNYLRIMTDRTPYICTPVRYQSKWVDHLEGKINKMEEIQLIVDGRKDFKLGDIINVVAFYQPEHSKLYYLRTVQTAQAQQEGISYLQLLAKNQINFQATRNQLLHHLSQYAQEQYCEYLLASLLSQQSLFLGCEANLAPLIQQLHPRVCNLMLKHPCEQSLFPYKDEDGKLIMEPLQLSSQRTFVIIDFSHFSSSSKVQINEKEIENFKALKVFVEEGKAIYRWEIGESLVDHVHIGLIIKGTSIITPHFNPKNQKITPDLANTTLSQQYLTKFRSYLLAALQITPKLNGEQRLKVEKVLFEQVSKEKLGIQLPKIMKLSKLMARSYGRSDILISDFQRARHLLGFDQQQ